MGFGVDNESLYVTDDTKLNKEISKKVDIMSDEQKGFDDFLKSLWSFNIQNIKLLNEPVPDSKIYAILDNTI